MSLREFAQRRESVTATVAMTPRQRHVLVEGESELAVLRPHLGGRAQIWELKGRPKVQEAWRVLSRHGAVNFLALIDADFDEVVGLNEEAPRLVYVALSGNKKDSTIDLEATLLRSRALQAVCERILGKKLLQYGGPVRFAEGMREALRVAAAEVGAFRAAVMSVFAERRSIQGIDELSADDWAAFVDFASGEADRSKLTKVMNGKVRHVEKFPDVVRRARDFWLDYGDGWLLCRGHDMTALLALRLSHIAEKHISRGELERELCQNHPGDIMMETAFGPKLKEFCAGLPGAVA